MTKKLKLNEKEYKEYVRIQNERSRGIERFDQLWFNRMFENFGKHLREPILDVGTRRGELLEFLKGKGFKDVWGVDISVPSVKVAKDLGLKVFRGDIQKETRFKDKQFRSVTMIDSFEHCYNPGLALEEIKRILSGTIYVQTVAQDESKREQAKPYGHFSFFPTAEKLEGIFKKHGFKTIRKWKEGNAIYYMGRTGGKWNV